jgi:hypothetical protein
MKNNNFLGFDEFLQEDVNTLKFRIKQLYQVLESSYDGIYITDGNANTIFLNRAYEEITGMKKKK